jgi:hypothetical protein
MQKPTISSAFSANSGSLKRVCGCRGLGHSPAGSRGGVARGWERQVHDRGADAVGESGARPASAPCRALRQLGVSRFASAPAPSQLGHTQAKVQ